MPKSSISRLTPTRLSWPSFAAAPAGSSMRALSVSSRRRLGAGSPDSSRTSHTRAGTSGCENWWPERLTLTATGGPPFACSCHRRASAHALRSTHRPRGTIVPISSASGMNSSGRSSPRSGCCHRTRASMPAMRCVARETTGWKWSLSSCRSRARRRSVSIPRRRVAAAYMGASKISELPGPRRLARYIAMSASRRTSWACS